ncbi:hypothetical protein KAK07_21200 [Ideonella sp. 4Y16]|uniref:hypothetical protein n=1 Tax=Ideonella alba TaxID=2824118 RepID=UPI001B38C2E5|nr:hypothetical protein [Ideonella alba]MBQ0945872.1 hypothetical protein [Ideonella alba]
MYARALFDLIHRHGDALLALLSGLEDGADELFASPNTLAAVEGHLLDIARTLAHLPPVVMLRLPQVDWLAWSAVLIALERQQSARREIVWYVASAALPATLVLLDELHRREPDWFQIHY